MIPPPSTAFLATNSHQQPAPEALLQNMPPGLPNVFSQHAMNQSSHSLRGWVAKVRLQVLRQCRDRARSYVPCPPTNTAAEQPPAAPPDDIDENLESGEEEGDADSDQLERENIYKRFCC